MHYLVLCATCEIQRLWKVSQSSGVEMTFVLLPVKDLLTIQFLPKYHNRLLSTAVLPQRLFSLSSRWRLSGSMCGLYIFYDQFDIWLSLIHPLHHSHFHCPLVLLQELKNLLLCHPLLIFNTSSAFVSPCSPTEAAAGEGDGPEDSGGWS